MLMSLTSQTQTLENSKEKLQQPLKGKPEDWGKLQRGSKWGVLCLIGSHINSLWLGYRHRNTDMLKL